MSNPIINVVALISGRGTNLQAIIDQTQSGQLPIKLCAVISDNPDAQGLLRAEAAGIPAQRVVRKDYESRNLFEQALIRSIDSHQPDLVLLAGFMRVLSNAFVEHYAGRLMNIHPSLLPAYPGLNTHARALADDTRQHGATVHFVTDQVDAGPVIIQATVPVKADDSAETLAARVLEQEHRIYPQAIRWFAEQKLQIVDNKVLLEGQQQSQQGLVTHSRPIRASD
ncbi:MAG: phosphoribosylglycinamide formyltransferase [Gammaproteobacteria bacterium]|nr:MAG: phosphoribosylglycinamide formyltransferase [Gammaproteobacteria bacterium]